MIFVELFFIVLFAVIVILTFRLVFKTTYEKRTQKNAEQILDSTFDGADTATYRVSSAVGLRFEQVLSGAEKRGYALHAQNKDTKKITTLVFKKAA